MATGRIVGQLWYWLGHPVDVGPPEAAGIDHERRRKAQ